MSKPTGTVFYFEDVEKVAKPIIEYLEDPPDGQHPKLEVKHYTNAQDALLAIGRWRKDNDPPSAALLDRHQPNWYNAGIDICERLWEKWPNIRVAFLSEKDQWSERKETHKAGAVTFLPKEDLFKNPDYLEYLRSVLDALMRTGHPAYLKVGKLTLSREDLRAWWDDNLVELSPAEFYILADLAENAPNLRTMNDLKRATKPDKTENLSEDGVRQCVTKIRTQLGKVDEKHKFVKNRREEEIPYGIVTKKGGGGYYWKIG